MALDLDSLRAFEWAATTLNFSSAAQHAHVSPAAFSERIRGLEETLGVKLFERTTRRVRLTAAGERLLPHAQASLVAATSMLEAARGVRSTWELTLGTRYELGLSWLVPHLDTLAATEPERTIHLRFGDGADLLDEVRLGRLDALVSSLRVDVEGLVSAPLHTEHYRFVAAPALLEKFPFVSPEDARAHTLIDASPSLPLFRYLLDPHGGPVWPFARRSYLGGIAAMRARVLAGHGVAILPEYFVRADLTAGALREIMPDHPPSADAFRLTWRAGHARGAALFQLAAELARLPLQ
jgi:LysR family glycine cleavage system transcriptional activator